MVVEVLVAQGEGHDPLGDHGLLVMDDEDGVAGVWDDLADGIEQADPLSDLPQQEGPGIRGQPAAQEISDD